MISLMTHLHKLKAYTKQNPSATVALFVLLLGVVGVLVGFATALYKDSTGVTCAGFFGVKGSCVESLYVGLSVFILNPVTVTIVLFLIILLGFDYFSRKARRKRR